MQLACIQTPLNPRGRIEVEYKTREIDKSSCFKGTLTKSGLFDFQEAAVDWLQKRVQDSSAGYGMLEMDTGCGKTRVVGDFFQRMIESF